MQLPTDLLEKSAALIRAWRPPRATAQNSLLEVTDLPDWRDLLSRGGPAHRQYAAHFEPQPLTEPSALHGRDSEIAELEQVLERWESGRACNVAMIGPEGSGKTSLLNSFVARSAERHALLATRLTNRVTSIEDLLAAFSALLGAETAFSSTRALREHILAAPRQIVVLEHGHQLCSRLVGGQHAAQAFFQLLIATRHHWMWVISFRSYPWERLAMTTQVRQYFTHELRTLYHEPQEIREIIETRHGETRLRLEFLADEGAESTQEERAAEFFRCLFAATAGNVAAAFYFWLLSVDDDLSGDIIRIKPLGSVELGYLRSLNRCDHFTLAEIIWHGGLSCAEHQQLFLQRPAASRLQLEHLAQLSLIEADSSDADGQADGYRLNPAFFKQVIAHLESLHLIY